VEDGEPAKHDLAGKPAKQAQGNRRDKNDGVDQPANDAEQAEAGHSAKRAVSTKRIEARDPAEQGEPIEPGKPNGPGKPGKPGEPAEPGKPIEPGKPGKPGKPAESIEPGKPGKPAEPAEPAESIEPGKPAEPIGPGEVRDPAERDEVDKLAEQWARSGMPPAAIARLELSKRVSRLALRHEQAMKTSLADLGLTYAEFDVLAALRRAAGPLRPSELTRSLFLTSGGTSNVLQRLTAAGYVEREANAADARSRWVRLTPAGESIVDKALITSTRVHEDLLAGIPDTTIRAAADALRDITRVTDRRH
jgi:DNA-binding MarR family transcriptional regulator